MIDLGQLLPTAYFLGFVGVGYGLARRFDVGRIFEGIDRFVTGRGLFTSSRAQLEVNLNLMRIVVGVLFLARTLSTAYATQFSLGSGTTTLATALALSVLCACLTVGLFTPIVLVFLLLFNNPFLDIVMGTRTLGTDVLHIILTVFLLGSAGRRFSVDGRLLTLRSRTGALLRRTYGLTDGGGVAQIRSALFVGLVAYSAIALWSTLQHTYNLLWQNGTVVGDILLLRQHDFFAPLFLRYPDAYAWFSAFSTYGMMIWELALFPLVLWRRTRPFAILWGAGFFAASKFILTLPGNTADYQLCLWALLFWPSQREGAAFPLQLRYDATCGRCSQILRWLAALDVRGLLRPLPEQRTTFEVVLPNGATVSGYPLWLLLTRKLLLLRVFWPLLALGAVTGAGPRLYARMRSQVRHVPGTSAAAAPPLRWSPVRAARAPLVPAVLFSSFCVALVVYLPHLPRVYDALFVRTKLSSPAAYAKNIYNPRYILPATRLVGLSPLDVYNDADLRVGRRALYLYRRDGVSTSKVENHLSEFLLTRFFRTWSLTRSGRPGYCYEDIKDGEDRAIVQLFVNYDLRLHGPPDEYLVRFTYGNLIDGNMRDLARRHVLRDPTETICTVHVLPAAPEPRKIDFDAGALVWRYPCEAEAKRIGYWFNRPLDVPRPNVALPLVRDLLSNAGELDPRACFARVQSLLTVMDMDWRPVSNPPPVLAPSCSDDLALARQYFELTSTEGLRARIAPLLARAGQAEARHDVGGCLLASSDARRTWLAERARVAAWPDPAPANPLVTDLSPSADPLVWKFPCSLEGRRIGYWFDHTIATPHAPAAETLLSLTYRDLNTKGAENCFVDIQATLSMIDIDWRPVRNPPPGDLPKTACRNDLDLATYYFVRVFTAAQRRAAAGSYDAAQRAAAAGDTTRCLLATAAVRRSYLHMRPKTDERRVTEVLTEAHAEALENDPFLWRFPCLQEARRIAVWSDHTTIKRTSDANARLQRLFRSVATGGPACYNDAVYALGAFDRNLVWAGGVPFPTNNLLCSADLELAAFYYTRIFDEKLQKKSAADYERARAAQQRGEADACVVASARVRLAYLEERAQITQRNSTLR